MMLKITQNLKISDSCYYLIAGKNTIAVLKREPIYPLTLQKTSSKLSCSQESLNSIQRFLKILEKMQRRMYFFFLVCSTWCRRWILNVARHARASLKSTRFSSNPKLNRISPRSSIQSKKTDVSDVLSVMNRLPQ